MKKIYVFIVVCLCLASDGFAQTYYWIGPLNGNWGTSSNWSNSPGGPAASDYPHLSTDHVIFNTDVSIQLNGVLSLNSLTVTGSYKTIKIKGSGSITLYGSNPGSPALRIAPNCTLENSAFDNTTFTFIFAADALGVIDGDWYFKGNAAGDALASFYLGDPDFETRLTVNSGGSISIGADAYLEANEYTGDEYLLFKNGARLNLQSNNPIIPKADYQAGSTIHITGVTNSSILIEETGSIGNLIYDCPSQSNGTNHLYLSLFGIVVKGDLSILNTNNQELALLSFDWQNLPSKSAIIEGDLIIQGNSRVAVAHNDGSEMPNHLYVEGDLVVNGTSFSLHTSEFITVSPTILYVKGNILHTAGTLTALSSVVNQTAHLFVIEMNGTTPQTISSHTGTFDNANNQVTLRINNAAGVSLLSPLQVGRLSFNTVNKGILSTNTNYITVNNTTPASMSGIVMDMPAGNASGFVNGTIRRRAASDEPLLMPCGSANYYRGVTVIPSSALLSTFEARFISSAHAGNIVEPLSGIADYYWNISRIGAGAGAAVQFSLPGAVPGADADDALIVARYNGSDWVSGRGSTGTTIIPGNSSSGVLKSGVQTSFGAFTAGYGLQSVLPTDLVSFKAEKTTKATALLRWRITENSTPSSFEVLRSADGVNFSPSGNIRGKEGQFNYEFTDHHILKGNNFYRLRMLDKDGSKTYSAIILLSNEDKGIFIHSMMPTIVNETAMLKISSSISGNMQLVITNISGHAVQSKYIQLETGQHAIMLNASALSAGTYQLTAYLHGRKTSTIRFIKL